MKTFFILALLAMAATMATAQIDPSQQYQPYQKQPFLQQQQSFFWQHPFFQPSQQQLNPCRQFLVQQCTPVAVMPFRRSQIIQQNTCQVTRQQCCQQLAQISEQARCPAIHSVVQSIILQLQQHGFFQPQLQQGFFQPQLQQGIYQPQLQQGIFQPQLQVGIFQSQLQHGVYQPQLQQGIYQPQLQAQFEGMRAFALQALPAMCDVYVPPHCSVATTPLSGF